MVGAASSHVLESLAAIAYAASTACFTGERQRVHLFHFLRLDIILLFLKLILLKYKYI